MTGVTVHISLYDVIILCESEHQNKQSCWAGVALDGTVFFSIVNGVVVLRYMQIAGL